MIENLIFPIDHILITIGSILIIFCFWKGIINSILGLLTWIGSILITIYFYTSLSNFLNKQILKIEAFSNYEQITDLLSTSLSIPIIFLFSLFILKKLRKIISSDIDSQILGKIIDKIFGFLFGFIFNYLIFTTVIYVINNFEFLNSFKNFLFENSFLLKELNTFNSNLLSGIFFEDNLDIN
tara:strand:+ start:2780 stop:3325 length:546 start_codon:yes stop_codon:yes gene_type:complete